MSRQLSRGSAGEYQADERAKAIQYCKVKKLKKKSHTQKKPSENLVII